MFRKVFKIFVLLLAVFPLWVTIVALAESPLSTPSEKWKSKLNTELLKRSSPRIQIIEFTPSVEKLDDLWLKEEVKLDLSRVNERGVSTIGLKRYDEEGRLLGMAKVSAKLLVQEQVPVASRDLTRGHVLSPGDIELKLVDASRVRGPIASQSQLVGRQLKSYVRAGDFLRTNKIQSEVLIRKGDRVRVSVVGQGIRVSSFGIAQEAGSEGDVIRLENKSSKREIYGRIAGPDRVEVNI